jgi:hypothetical protein
MTSYRHEPQFEPNPELEAVIEEALQDTARLVPPELLVWMRNELRMQLLMHPYTAALIAELAPNPTVQESGARAVGHDEVAQPSGVRSGAGR